MISGMLQTQMTDSSPKRIKAPPEEKQVYVVSQVILYHDYKRSDVKFAVKGAFLDKESAWKAAFEGIASGNEWQSVLDHESEGESDEEEHSRKHTDKLEEIRALPKSWEEKKKVLVGYIESVVDYAEPSGFESWQVQSTTLDTGN